MAVHIAVGQRVKLSVQRQGLRFELPGNEVERAGGQAIVAVMTVVALAAGLRHEIAFGTNIVIETLVVTPVDGIGIADRLCILQRQSSSSLTGCRCRSGCLAATDSARGCAACSRAAGRVAGACSSWRKRRPD